MSNKLTIIVALFSVFLSNTSTAEDDSRQLVKLPEMMQQHMMSNMRNHLDVINQVTAVPLTAKKKA